MGWLTQRLGELSSSLTTGNSHGDEAWHSKDRDDISLPLARNHNDLDTSHAQEAYNASPDTTAATQRNSADKIRALDGLRGIACLIVYNYHFLWPWTPLILLGYGSRPPLTPEAYSSWTQLPILCLLHRGRPMVAIFFAISGYVVCRHVLRIIVDAHDEHKREVMRHGANDGVGSVKGMDKAYHILATASFRRVFRLYTPATLSMLLVAVLAQLGGFKTEFDVYHGPDSVYINGSVGTYSGTVDGWRITGVRGSLVGSDGTSVYLSPTVNAGLLVFGPGGGSTSPASGFRRHPSYSPKVLDGDWSCEGCPWVKLGGMWEEHPLVYDSLWHAATNFTKTYNDWANPFTFNAQHTRYDPHTYTMPMELRGSMVLYLFLLATARLQAVWRLVLGLGLAMYALRIGRWEIGTFLGGMVLSEVDIHLGWQGNNDTTDEYIADSNGHGHGHARKKSTDRTLPRHQHHPSPHLSTSAASRQPRLRARLIRYTILFISLYLLSYPDTHAEVTPGFRTLAAWCPRYYPMSIEKWRFYHALGALLFLPCALRTRFLAQTVLESEPAQYLGKISFAFYLVHGPVLHSLGFWIMPRLFDAFGGKVTGEVNVAGLLFGWALLGLTSLCLADVWYRKVDVWSVGVGRRVERFMSGGL
ncbi:acyltransferase family-domain-containing protein [Microdochium trichocladiopsis]|uniref:Acyltransferase family-domain-containing protein n=1 Tax=Microdochium trichocladiopsis TaxID=1682393 RepID=A0A9P8XY36_9PEZI|nr:acyltransferase family-domain-containing protein [Microdochium trichocladiopsis]KAH7024917.1 acyltransferase family-domain-containing protein [Microdochium trichocladiopsis]